LRVWIALLGRAPVPLHGSLVVDLDAVPVSIKDSNLVLSEYIYLRRRELEQLHCLLKVRLGAHLASTVRLFDFELRHSIPLVHVLLHPAQPFGSRLVGWRAAERGALVVILALVGASRAHRLAAARI